MVSIMAAPMALAVSVAFGLTMAGQVEHEAVVVRYADGLADI